MFLLFTVGVLCAGQVGAQMTDGAASSALSPRHNRVVPEASAFIRDGGVLASFSPLPAQTGSGTVNATLNLPDGKVLIAGNIPSVAGVPQRDIARLNADGTPDLSFNTGTGSNGNVRRLHLQPDGKILASGAFSLFNDVPRSFIVRLNPDGGVDTSFSVSSSIIENLVVCDVQPDGKIIVCGNFTIVNGEPRRHIARLNPDGSLDQTFNFSDPTSIHINAVRFLPDGKLLVGGVFNFNTNTGIKRLNPDGSLDQTFTPGVGFGFVGDLQVLPDGRFIACGGNDQVRRFNADGNPDPTFNTDHNFQGTTRVVVQQPDGKILVGGEFSLVRVGTVTRASYRVARLNADGSFDTDFVSPFDSSSNGGVNAIALRENGKIMIGGSFMRTTTSPLSAVVKVNSDGVPDESFRGQILRRGIIFSQFIDPDGKILLGGTFDMLNLSPRRFIGRLDPNGLIDDSFNTSDVVEGVVRIIVRQPDGKYIVGGATSDFGNKALWRINPDGSPDRTLNVTFNSSTSVTAAALQADGKILIGGNFNTVNGVARRGLARLNPDGSLDAFNVDFGASGGAANGIIVQADGKILIGGGFFEINGNTTVRNVARLNPDGSLDTTFNPNTNGTFIRVDGLHQLNGRIFVAGAFSGNDSSSRSPLIRLNENGSADYSFNAGTLVGNVFSIAAQPDGKILVGGEFNTFAESGTRKYIVRVLENGSLDYAFDAGALTNVPNNPNTPFNSVRQVAVLDGNKILISGSFDYVEGETRWSTAQLKLNPCTTRTAADFDGDGKTDLSVFRPSNNVWYRQNSYSNGFRAFQFALSTDKLVPADYDGDGRTDAAVFRPSTGTWYIFNSGNGSYRIEQFGLNGDKPSPADYDGDGRADLAVFRPSTGIWYQLQSRSGFAAIQFGLQNDVPVAGDFDGDCKSDIAVFRPAGGEWWYLRSSDAVAGAVQFGSPVDKPVPADYTGDGRTDIAVYRPDNRNWYVLRSEDFSYYAAPFGTNGDIPAPGDYDADGKTDFGVFRPQNGLWFVNRTTGGVSITGFGTEGDLPLPSVFVP